MVKQQNSAWGEVHSYTDRINQQRRKKAARTGAGLSHLVQGRDKPTDPAMRKMFQQLAEDMQNEAIPVEELEALESVRPADVVSIRQQLFRWWSQDGEWQRRFAMQGRRAIGDSPWTAGANETRIFNANALGDAELYWVSPKFSEVIAKLYPSIPDCLPQPPCKIGFVVFSRSIPGTDAASGTSIWTTAMLWAPVQTLAGPCLAIETYAWRDIVMAYRAMNGEEKEMFRDVLPSCQIMPTGGCEWPTESEVSDFSVLPAEDVIMQASMIEDRRVLACFWALASQKITLEEHWRPDRATARRSERLGMKNPYNPVRVIKLREVAPRPDAGVGRDTEWSHRWIVGSHWRSQWYPSTGRHRPKLIDSYIKGPADKPLVVKETVRALVR
jgi:hypothetical protein